MSEQAQQYAIKSANEAFDRYTGRKDTCEYIWNAMVRKYGSRDQWHVILGDFETWVVYDQIFKFRFSGVKYLLKFIYS